MTEDNIKEGSATISSKSSVFYNKIQVILSMHNVIRNLIEIWYFYYSNDSRFVRLMLGTCYRWHSL